MPIVIKDFNWSETEKIIDITIPLTNGRPSSMDVFSTSEYLKVKIICDFSFVLNILVIVQGWVTK